MRIRAVLTRPRFGQLLDIAGEFGLKRLLREWEILDTENTLETQRARPIVERVLRNIEEGFRRADSGN